MIHARERQQGTTADGHSLEEAQFKTLRSACSLKPESQIENRIRCVTLGYLPSLLPDTPGIFALLPSLFTSAVECLSGRLHSTTCLVNVTTTPLLFSSSDIVPSSDSVLRMCLTRKSDQGLLSMCTSVHCWGECASLVRSGYLQGVHKWIRK